MAAGEEGADAETWERSNAPTPAGARYSIAYFRDSAGRPCPKSKAAKIEIVEFDDGDNALQRTYLTR